MELKFETENTGSLFRPKLAEEPTPLLRQRPTNHRDFARFGPGPDGFEVFVHRRALAQLVTHFRQSVPDEAMGLLAGRPGRDERGPYTVITGAIRATEGDVEASPGRVRVGADGQLVLRRQLARAEPLAEPVGWWHTHPHGPDALSREDVREQATWPGPHNVGLLVSGQSNRLALIMYHGPEATLLDKHFFPRNLGTKTAGRRPSGKRRPRREPAHPIYVGVSPSIMVLLILAWLSLALILAGGFTLFNQRLEELSSIQALNSPKPELVEPAGTPLFTFGCDPRQGSAPLTVTCKVYTDRSFVEMRWRFADGVLFGGSSVSYTYQTPGDYDLSLIGVEPDGTVTEFQLGRVRVESSEGAPGAVSPLPPPAAEE